MRAKRIFSPQLIHTKGELSVWVCSSHRRARALSTRPKRCPPPAHGHQGLRHSAQPAREIQDPLSTLVHLALGRFAALRSREVLALLFFW